MGQQAARSRRHPGHSARTHADPTLQALGQGQEEGRDRRVAPAWAGGQKATPGRPSEDFLPSV